MDSLSNLASMNIQSRKEFVNSFVSEIILNIHRRHIAELTKREIEDGLLEEVEKQKREIERIERIEEAKLITRQFIPSIINPIQQIVEQAPVPVPAEIQEKTETTEEEEKPLTIGNKIDPLFLQYIKMIECANGNVRIKKNQEFEQTEIELSEAEIRDIIKKFSELTKIPPTDNVLRATLNNFTITAIISDKIGSRFLIKRTDAQEQSIQEVKKQKQELKEEIKRIEINSSPTPDKRWYVTIEQPVEETGDYDLLKEIERKNKETERVMEEQAKKLKKEFTASIISRDK